MPISPSNYSAGVCDVTLGMNGCQDTVIDNMKVSFNLSPNYKQVYIIHDSSTEQTFLHDIDFNNSYGISLYDSWIFDGTEEENTVGHKYIQMYPYDNPVLKEGDYVVFDYYYNGQKSTWLCVAFSSDSEYEQIGKIRMCTNEVRFYNQDGELVRIPCVFDNKINSEKNVTLSNLKYINGITTIYMQLNEDSTQITPNQRLLFGRPGNWTAFKVVSVGVNNFMNTVYFDNSTAKILEITMEAAYVNYDTDDLINGIADANTYSINISQDNFETTVGQQIQLTANVVMNGNMTVDKPVVWSSSNNEVATVNSDGIVETVGEGSATVTATMENNSNVYGSVEISVVSQPTNTYEIILSPYFGDNYGILQGETQVFSCYLYLNGEQQDVPINFTLNTNANDSSYVYNVIDSNSFSIQNIRMDKNEINIICSYESYDSTFHILLKGAW